MRSLLLAMAALLPLWGQTPLLRVRQGDAIPVKATDRASSARMAGRTVPLFRQADGSSFGLMPVAADQPPGRTLLEHLDASGGIVAAQPVEIEDAHFPKQNVHLQPEVDGLKPSPGEMETVSAFRKTVSDARHWEEPLVRPIAGCMSSPYGVQRLYNGRPTGNYHSGVDQRSPAGTPIKAVAGGTIRLVRSYNVHGNVVGIDHGQGLSSIYLHMSKFALQEGAVVTKGEIIGYVGSTGRSTGPHLHWNLYANGVAINPVRWVRLTPCASRIPRAKK